LERATLGFAFAGDAAFPDSIDALLRRAAPALAAELPGIRGMAAATARASRWRRRP